MCVSLSSWFGSAGGADELLLPPSQGQHTLRLPLLRPHPAEWLDPAIPTARKGRRLLQRVPAALPGEPGPPARHRRAVPAVVERVVREARYPGSGGAERPSRRCVERARRSSLVTQKTSPSRTELLDIVERAKRRGANLQILGLGIDMSTAWGN